MMYIFKTIWWLDRKVMSREVVLKMILLDDLSNSFSFIRNIKVVEMLYFYMNIVLTKQ